MRLPCHIYLPCSIPRVTAPTLSATQIVLIDPPGSSLFNAVTRGVAFAHEDAEGTRLRHPCDTITEGIGINRLTANFLQAQARLPYLFSQKYMPH